MRVQLEVPGVLNVQPRPTPVATVVNVCVNRFARCAAGLFAYQISDAINLAHVAHEQCGTRLIDRRADAPIPADMKAVSPGQLVSAIP